MRNIIQSAENFQILSVFPIRGIFLRILFLNKKKTLDYMSPSLVMFLFSSSVWTNSSVFVIHGTDILAGGGAEEWWSGNR